MKRDSVKNRTMYIYDGIYLYTVLVLLAAAISNHKVIYILPQASYYLFHTDFITNVQPCATMLFLLIVLYFCQVFMKYSMTYSLIARFMGPTWSPSGADRTQVGPILAPWTLLSGLLCPSCIFLSCEIFEAEYQCSILWQKLLFASRIQWYFNEAGIRELFLYYYFSNLYSVGN